MNHPVETPLSQRRELGSDATPSSEAELAKRWLFLGAGSLLLSGLLAILLALARTPFFDKLVSDPLFFRRGLVIHVDLALLVWIFSFVTALFTLLPMRRRISLGARASVVFGLAGLMLLLASAGAKGSKPILANYVPVIDHPIFLAGLITFAFGVFLAVANRRLLPSEEAGRGLLPMPAAARIALRSAGIAVIAALLSFAGSWVSTSPTFVADAYFETLFWGGGHVLQAASVSAMVAVWLMLLAPVVGTDILSRRAAWILFAILLLPVLYAPLLALRGPTSPYYRIGFTWMMQWGIFPVVSIILLLCARALCRSREHWRIGDPRLLGFFASAGLTVLGFVLGAMIRGSNTMIPAHYHAAIGAVTAAFMAVTFQLLPALGIAISFPRLARLQPMLFGAGQAVFALGFGLAGHFGMGRKVYGAEQLHRSLPETIGLSIMGLGGLVAAAGGLIYLAVVFISWRRSQLEQEARLSTTLPTTDHEGLQAGA